MTLEETLLAERILKQRGYTYIWRHGRGPFGYHIRARRHPAWSWRGLRENVTVVLWPEDLARIR